MEAKKWYTFDDLALLPSYSVLDSRTTPDLTSRLTTKTNVALPFIPSPMSSVIGLELGKKLIKNQIYPVYHRFYSNAFELEDWINEIGNFGYISWGLDRLDELVNIFSSSNIKTPRGVCFDVAHGHCKKMKEAIEYVKQRCPEVEVIAGTVCTPIAASDLSMWGADAIRVGIGAGCFAAGTKVLMGNGYYKPIEQVQSGDRVINRYGNPVTVKKAWSTGLRKVIRLKSNSFYTSTTCTPDHKFLQYDISNLKDSTIASYGYKKCIKRKVPDWFPISELRRSVLLAPSKINFELPDSFNINICKRNIGVEFTLTPSFELGYLFGFFLGNGTSHISNYKNSTRGSVSWATHKDKLDIIEKLHLFIKTVFNKESKVIYSKSRPNGCKIVLYSKPLADFLSKFGKRINKKLPENLLVNNISYLKGIFEGLKESDGSYSGSQTFSNTSQSLIELYYTLSNIIEGHWPISWENKINNPNWNQSYSCKSLINPNNRQNEEFNLIKFLDYEELSQEVEVFDIEVDCPSHSFVANNCIVHNSACTTRLVTGFGAPQFSAIHECALALKRIKSTVPIIADGGIRNSRDIALALAAGASTVMLGKMFCATEESAGQWQSGYKIYKGQASAEFQKQNRAAEGLQGLVKVKGTVDDLLKELSENLRSSFSYAGAANISQFHQHARWVEVTGNYLDEAYTRFDSKG